MRIRRLKELVKALEALPDDIKNREASKNVKIPVDTYTGFRFSPFTGLISIVAEDIPEFKKFYTLKDKYDSNGDIILNPYLNYVREWNFALCGYLKDGFVEWILNNSEVWGNENGQCLYNDDGLELYAFGKEGSKTLFNYQIIDHLVSVCIRYDEMIKTKPKHTTTITATVMTIFYVFYSFSISKHQNQYPLFFNVFFDMFVVGCLMIGKHLNYKYIDIIQFIALPITISVLLNTYQDFHFYQYKNYRFHQDFPFYLALIVLLINGFCISTVFSSEPMKWVHRFLKWKTGFWQADDVEFEKKTNKEKNNEQR